MRKIIISCDSTCDLSEDTVRYYGMTIVPLSITLGEEVLKDGVDIRGSELYEKAKTTKEHPKSTAPSPAEYLEKFQPLIDSDCDIIHISIGSGFSSSYQHAVIAANELPQKRVFVIDGHNLSAGSGLLALKAAKLRGEGMTAEEIYTTILSLRDKVRTQFVIDTLDYLHKGGRCSGLAKIIGSLLRIKPNIKVVHNSMQVARKARGMRQGLQMMFGDMEGDYLYMDHDYVIIGHSQAEKEAMKIYDKLLEMGFKRETILIIEPGCVVSTHCGPGTVGVMYLLK